MLQDNTLAVSVTDKTSLTDWKSLNLWDHQKLAIEFIESFLDNDGNSAAMVRMPTGTGKSGVIAVAAHFLENVKCTLILVPAIALREQLAEDIKHRFWNKIGADKSLITKTVVEIMPGPAQTEKAISTATDQTILVTTIQLLQVIQTNNQTLYNNIKRLISFVIFDEGHREPAPMWAEAVRGLEKPTVLFSATPYRNDYKLFNINQTNTYGISYIEALEGNYVRKVKFKEIDEARSSVDFIDKLIEFTEEYDLNHKPSLVDKVKVIVRCETHSDVNELTELLRLKGKSVAGIHERFQNGDSSNYKTVKKAKETDPVFWVHQYKLVEGIDDPSFCILAIYQAFGSDRPFIQQVGRVLRNVAREVDQTAFVFSYKKDNLSHVWNKYKEYETLYSQDKTISINRKLYDEYADLQSSYDYIDYRFRKKFEIDTDDVHLSFKYPLSVRVFKRGSVFDFDELIKAVQEEWSKNDYEIRKVSRPLAETVIIAYVTYSNSAVLLEDILLEVKVGFTVIRQIGDTIFFQDSNGASSEYLSNNSSLFEPERLQALFKGNNASISQISLLNTDLGLTSVRRRTISAASVADTAPALIDHLHFCSTATGVTESGMNNNRTMRYIGFTRSRVRDTSKAQDFTEFIQWTDHINTVLTNVSVAPYRLFERFAIPVNVTRNSVPKHILIDFEDQNKFIKSNRSTTLQLDEISYDIENNAFILKANNEEFPISIKYEATRKVYLLSSKKLESAYIMQSGVDTTRRENILTYLNRKQSFRIVLDDSKVIYAHSNFYQPKLRLGGRGKSGKFDLLNIFTPLNILSTINSEKGDEGTATASGWDTNCLFHLLDTLGVGTDMEPHLSGTDILICDDLGNEIADFIAVNFRAKRISFYHLKEGRDKKKSASVFHDACGQATKNLHWIHPFSEVSPGFDKWDGTWTSSGPQRIRRPIPNTDKSKVLWLKITELIRDPSSTKEVCIVLSRGFSLDKFQKSCSATKLSAVTVQILYLLQSTWGAAASVNANFKVFCSK